MAGKADFTTEEWNSLIEAVMLAGTAVTAADPSGIWGTLKEGMANAGALRDVWQGATDNPLLKDIATEFTTSEGRSTAKDGLRSRFEGAGREDMMSRSTDALKDVVALVDAKAPDEAPEFKQFLMGIAQKVAEAAKEGGFMGIGGERVSAAEQSALDEISRILS